MFKQGASGRKLIVIHRAQSPWPQCASLVTIDTVPFPAWRGGVLLSGVMLGVSSGYSDAKDPFLLDYTQENSWGNQCQ